MDTCRTCLVTPAKKDISDLEKNINDDSRKCIDIIAFCLDIKVTEDSKITTKLCNSCFSKIISYYKFKLLSLKNDAYLKSLDQHEQSKDQKLTVYEDENGIKHENYLELDDFGPTVIEYCNRDIKTEVDVKDEDVFGDLELNVKEEDGIGDVESDEELQSVEQKNKYENCEETKEDLSQNIKQQFLKCKACPKMFESTKGRNRHYQTKHIGKKSKCDVCNKEVVCLSTHKLRVHNPSRMRFSCATCARRFVSRAVLDLHVLSHTKDYRFQCDLCQKKFSCKPILSKHMRQIHDKERNHKCEHCPKAFFDKHRLQEHLRSHTKERKSSQICEECGKAVANLREHMLSHQPKDERRLLKCKACPKTFYTIGGRKRHYRVSHLGKKPTCDICNKQVVSVSDHKKRVHDTAELPFVCLECGRRCLSKSLLDVHMLTHTKDFQHECETCQKKFSTKTFLSKHKREVHEKEKNHQCEFCSKAFFSKQRLKEHIRSHTNERPYTCGDCGLSFITKQSLTRHLLTHSDVKNYPCKLCGMSFRVPGNLKTHMVSHTKEKRYPCGFCGVRFGRSDHRNRHEFTAHKKHGLSKMDKKLEKTQDS